MSAKNIRICRYQGCKHDSKKIDISIEEYSVRGNMYYHKDCFLEQEKREEKTVQEKADIQLIRNLWLENIDRTLVYSQLYSVLNDFLSRGIESDYLVFVMRYIVSNKLSLKYPAGFRYYVGDDEILAAYKKKKAQAVIGNHQFKTTNNLENDPKFSVGKKQRGFQNIFNN